MQKRPVMSERQDKSRRKDTSDADRLRSHAQPNHKTIHLSFWHYTESIGDYRSLLQIIGLFCTRNLLCQKDKDKSRRLSTPFHGQNRHKTNMKQYAYRLRNISVTTHNSATHNSAQYMIPQHIRNNTPIDSEIYQSRHIIVQHIIVHNTWYHNTLETIRLSTPRYISHE